MEERCKRMEGLRGRWGRTQTQESLPLQVRELQGARSCDKNSQWITKARNGVDVCVRERLVGECTHKHTNTQTHKHTNTHTCARKGPCIHSYTRTQSPNDAPEIRVVCTVESGVEFVNHEEAHAIRERSKVNLLIHHVKSGREGGV